jgi:AhpD family alkylhydroperoxidase
MSRKTIDQFQRERSDLNELVMKHADLTIQRFFSLDAQTYREGALPRPTKELLGLVASLVLRCDDCIQYHVIRCHEEGVTTAELVEALGVGLVVGGSIVIPHLRRAFATWEELTAPTESEARHDQEP